MKQVDGRNFADVMSRIRSSKKNQMSIAVVVLAFGVIGCVLLFPSHAATPVGSVQGEAGTVNSPASSVTDSSASGGSAVKFGGGSSGGLTMVWNDEFNGTSVDTTKWNVRTEATSYDEVYNLPANVTETGGNLIITGKRESYGDKPYTAGYLDTIGKKGFRYGKFEMRAKLPDAKGVSRGIWPAWWMRADNGATGEIDAMEAWGDPGLQTGVPSEDPFGRVLGTVWQDTNNASGAKSGGWSGAVGSLDLTQWHTYAVLWNSTGITWYVDNIPFRSATYASYPWMSASFPATVNLRLNLQISNKYYGFADASTVLPAQFIVDYVRIYQ